MSVPSPRPIWTDAMDDTLRAMWPVSKGVDIYAALGITRHYVRRRAKVLGLMNVPKSEQYTPTPELWLSIASETAREFGVRPAAIVGATKSRSVCRVRWEAWRRLKAHNPQFTLAGIGRVTGWDHTTILWGLRKLEEGAR